MVQIINLQELLEIFNADIIKSIKLLYNKFGKENLMKKWRSGEINRVGFLDDREKIEYSFHGSGCNIEFEDGSFITFDFDEHDSPHFDLFKFKLYVLSKELYPENEVESIFESIKLIKTNKNWELKRG